MNAGRHVQEPGVRALPGDGAGAEPELPLADRSSRRTTTSARPNPTSRTTSRPACASTTTTRRTAASSFAATATSFEESSLVDWTYDSPDPQFRGLHDVARARFSWSVTGTWTKVLERVDGHRHADFGQPRPSARHAQEHGQLLADVGRPAGVPGRLLPGALRVHPAAEQHRRNYRTRAWAARSTAASGSRRTRGSRTSRARAGRTPGAAAWTCSGPSAPAATAPATWGRSTTTTRTPARPTPRTCFRRSRSA